jgi:hypothetical protein
MEDNQQQSSDNEKQSSTPPDEPTLQQPESTPPATPQQVNGTEPKNPKPKSKLLVILLVVLLLVGGAAAYYFYTSEDTTSTTDNQQTANTELAPVNPSVFSQNGDKVEYVDESGALANYITLEPNQYFIEAFSQDGGVTATYYESETAENGGSYYTEYGLLKDGIKLKTIQLPENVNVFSNLVLSPDKKTFVVEVGDESDFMANLTSVNIQDGTTQIVYEPETQTEGLRAVVGWLDNENVLLQQQTCRQCDGPRLPVLYKLNITSKQMTPFFNEANTIEGMDYAGFYLSSDNSTLLMFGGDYSKVFGGDDIGTEYDPTYLYEIDMETAEAREVAQFTGGYENINGLSADGSSAYLSTFEWVATDDPNAPWQTTEGNYIQDVPKLFKINITNGQRTEIPLESRLIKQGTRFGTVIENEGELYFTTIITVETTQESYGFSKLGTGDNATISVLSEANFPAGEGSIQIFQAAN